MNTVMRPTRLRSIVASFSSHGGWILCAVLMMCGRGESYAQTFGTPVRVNTTMGVNEHSPVMHAGRDGNIYVSWFANNADIYFARSRDNGASFTTPVRASRQVTTNVYTSLLQRVPNFAIDTKGTIHLIWMEDRINKQSDLWYIRSTDQGATWTAPVSIMDANDSAKYPQDFPAIAVDSSDNLYVSYLDFRGTVRGVIDHPNLHLTRSTDGGQTWSAPVVANKFPNGIGGTCECCRQDIAVSPEGHVYIAFRSNITNKRDIWIARSTDAGKTFLPTIKAQLGTWTIEGCPTTGPRITLDRNEDLTLAWRDARDDSSRSIAYAAVLFHGEDSVYTNVSMSNSATQEANWPDVAVSPRGLMAYTYMVNGRTTRMKYSLDGGNSWSNEMVFPGSTSTEQMHPTLEFDAKGNLYALWQDVNDQGDIYFARMSTLPSRSPLGELKTTADAYYQPGKPATIRWSAPSELRATPFVYYTVTLDEGTTHYEATTHSTALIIDSLPIGLYNYRVVAHTLSDSTSNNGMFAVAQLGVEDRSDFADVRIFPNPVTNGAKLHILLSGLTSGPVSVKLYDMRGNVIDLSNIEREGDQLVLNGRELASGTYFCEIVSGKQRWTSPLVVQ